MKVMVGRSDGQNENFNFLNVQSLGEGFEQCVTALFGVEVTMHCEIAIDLFPLKRHGLKSRGAYGYVTTSLMKLMFWEDVGLLSS